MLERKPGCKIGYLFEMYPEFWLSDLFALLEDSPEFVKQTCINS
jgi:hypothetical protein